MSVEAYVGGLQTSVLQLVCGGGDSVWSFDVTEASVRIPALVIERVMRAKGDVPEEAVDSLWLTCPSCDILRDLVDVVCGLWLSAFLSVAPCCRTWVGFPSFDFTPSAAVLFETEDDFAAFSLLETSLLFGTEDDFTAFSLLEMFLLF